MLSKAQLRDLVDHAPAETPTLLCRPHGSQVVTDPCPYCRAKHFHGRVGLGHRGAHCVPPNILYRDADLMKRWQALVDRGYVLRLE